jgi:hypothetical protein
LQAEAEKPEESRRKKICLTMKKLCKNEMCIVTGGSKFGCALAIAGSIAVTAGAAFVTGGASLIIFLISKGIATATIVDACGDLIE